MTYTFDEQISKDEWEHFLSKKQQPPFLQSYTMREMHSGLGEETVTIGIRDAQSTVVGVALGILVDARRGRFLYFPYGPVMLSDHLQKVFTQWSIYIKQKGKELNCDFIRSSPFIVESRNNIQLYRRNGWNFAPIHMLAEHVWWLDITLEEDELMKGFRKTMRNLIRRAGRDGVTIRKSTDIADVEVFIEIHKDTVQRHGFVPYSDNYFREQFKAFVKDDQALMLIAEYEGKPIAASMIMYYGNMGSYHHGASLSKYNKIPATYLMQWEAIKEAKKRGCVKYNFWGIVPEEKFYSKILKRPHPFIGVTKFKTGFGGERIDLLHAQDMPLTPKYFFTYVIETFRRVKRGF